MDRTTLLRQIPKVDTLLALDCLRDLSGPALIQAVRSELDALRAGILDGSVTDLPSQDALCLRILTSLRRSALPSLRPVVNATGVILHTNLGRACLSAAAVDQVCRVAAGYSTLEYNVATGSRGSRFSHVESLLCTLTGAEAAMVVNNNAAAVLLTLSALTRGREVPISRGELVEIGGAFRVPEVMEQSGTILREVGTTNKTHLSDYENAICAETGALLKVHTSNYRILGFTESVSLETLTELAHRHGLPLIEDLGSGAMLPPERFGITDEPYVRRSIAAGADIVCFSGDKLMGGPQAGIILGRADLIAAIRSHPLARAVRIDKLTLAALEATLRLYLDEEKAQREIPVCAMLGARSEALEQRAHALLSKLEGIPGAVFALLETRSPVGGGSVPVETLSSWGVSVQPCALTPDELEQRLRLQDTPVIVRIWKERCVLDVRTLLDGDDERIVHALRAALSAPTEGGTDL